MRDLAPPVILDELQEAVSVKKVLRQTPMLN
jgi:hypothetical protein